MARLKLLRDVDIEDFAFSMRGTPSDEVIVSRSALREAKIGDYYSTPFEHIKVLERREESVLILRTFVPDERGWNPEPERRWVPLEKPRMGFFLNDPFDIPRE